MPFVVAALIAAVTFSRGGYAASGVLLAELGAVVLVGWVLLEVVFTTTDASRARYRRQPRGASPVEILAPGESDLQDVDRPAERFFFPFGFPLRRTHLGLPVLLGVGWIALSLVSLPPGWLSWVSPAASSLRGGDGGPTSLAPFLTLRSLWMALAYMAFVFVGAQIGSRPERARKLSFWMFVLAVGFGAYGMAQWLFGLQNLFGRDPTTAYLRASGSFGNRNHYAAFMSLTLLTGLGWVGAVRGELVRYRASRSRGWFRRLEATGGQMFFLGLGVVAAGLGLVFSLSRSGIAFALIGAAIFALLQPVLDSRSYTDLANAELRRTGPGRLRGAAALALALVAVTAWIGLDPVVHRFKLLPDEWEAEQGRVRVWADSLDALSDYALTGSGLSTYRYVFPIYRSFGGTVAYSWAHNDYLQAAIELGLPGLFLLLWTLGVVAYRAYSTRRFLAGNPAQMSLHAGCVAAVAAVSLHSATDFGLHMTANAVLFCLLLGVVVGFEPCEERAALRNASPLYQ